jgi:hypothetical protein
MALTQRGTSVMLCISSTCCCRGTAMYRLRCSRCSCPLTIRRAWCVVRDQYLRPGVRMYRKLQTHGRAKTEYESLTCNTCSYVMPILHGLSRLGAGKVLSVSGLASPRSIQCTCNIHSADCIYRLRSLSLTERQPRWSAEVGIQPSVVRRDWTIASVEEEHAFFCSESNIVLLQGLRDRYLASSIPEAA